MRKKPPKKTKQNKKYQVLRNKFCHLKLGSSETWTWLRLQLLRVRAVYNKEISIKVPKFYF